MLVVSAGQGRGRWGGVTHGIPHCLSGATFIPKHRVTQKCSASFKLACLGAGNSLPEAAWGCKTAQAVKLLKYLDLVHTELLDTAARSGLRADNVDLHGCS